MVSRKLTCSDIKLHKGSFRLNVPNLVVDYGEKVALMGENGCGKTTLMQIMAHVNSPDEGVISLDERPLRSLSAEQRAVACGYLPQDSGVLFSHTVGQLLQLYTPRAAVIRNVDQMLSALELDHLLDRDYQTLSGGEKRRGMLARILYRDLGVFLLDEPTAPLDLRHSLKAMGYIKQLDCTVIAAQHDINIALRYFDRFIFMKKGEIIYDKMRQELDETIISDVYGVAVHYNNGYFIPE